MRGCRQRGQQSSGAASYTRKHYIRTDGESQIKDPQQAVLEYQGLKAGKLCLKEKFRSAEQGKNDGNLNPDFMSPAGEIDSGKGQHDDKYDETHAAGAGNRLAFAQLGLLQFGKTPRQQQPRQS